MESSNTGKTDVMKIEAVIPCVRMLRYRLLVFAVAMYPTISDRILRTKDYYCHFVPAENPQFVIALSFLGHHIPCIVIVVCYIIVFIEIRKLFKSRPGAKAPQAKAKAKTNTVAPAPATVATIPSSFTAEPIASTSRAPAIEHGETSIMETALDDKANHDESATAAVSDNKEKDQKKEQKQEKPQKPQQQKRQAAVTHASTDAQARAQRERKSFVTLSYIVIGYVVCWVPFHFVYDVSFIRPELVSDDLYTATFWLTYVNSLINPFLYAFSSADLRSAVVKILKCRCDAK